MAKVNVVRDTALYWESRYHQLLMESCEAINEQLDVIVKLRRELAVANERADAHSRDADHWHAQWVQECNKEVA